jgi:hypothetical protein
MIVDYDEIIIFFAKPSCERDTSSSFVPISLAKY